MCHRSVLLRHWYVLQHEELSGTGFTRVSLEGCFQMEILVYGPGLAGARVPLGRARGGRFFRLFSLRSSCCRILMSCTRRRCRLMTTAVGWAEGLRALLLPSHKPLVRIPLPPGTFLSQSLIPPDGTPVFARDAQMAPAVSRLPVLTHA